MFSILKLDEIIENILRYVICYKNDLFSSEHKTFYRVVFKTKKILMIISVHSVLILQFNRTIIADFVLDAYNWFKQIYNLVFNYTIVK